MQNLNTAARLQANADVEPAYRIGAVARLSGVAVGTLRVWEKRHAALSPSKSEGLHRLYSEADVMRARLLRQLTESGHSIGQVARQPTEKLQAMLGRAQSTMESPQRSERPRVRTVVVGSGIAARLHARDWVRRFGDMLDVSRVFVDLDEGLLDAGASVETAELLLARLNTLHDLSREKLAALAARLQVGRAIVLYNYGGAPQVEALRAMGMIVRREPLGEGEFAELLHAVLLVDTADSIPALGGGALIPQRRYSEATLSRVAASPNSVVCECPKHIAELITQLASFEEYSEQCLNDSAEDARLHAYLRSIAGSTRALFEHALQIAARHGGLDLAEERIN